MIKILRFKPCKAHPSELDCWCGSQYEYLTRQGEPIKVVQDPPLEGYVQASHAFVLYPNGWWRGWFSAWRKEIAKGIKGQQTPNNLPWIP